MATAIPLERVTSLAVDPGVPFVVRGLVTTSIDGSSFDATSQYDGLAHGAYRAGGLFDLAAGGLRIVEQHADRHEYALAWTGGAAPGCAAIGAPSPCLLPRLPALARERLRTSHELAATLTGSLEVEVAPAAPLGALARPMLGVLTIAGVLGAVALGAGAALLLAAKRGGGSALARVRTAAREAIRATQGDATLRPLRPYISAMLARAAELDAARRACARKLARIDAAALDRKRQAYAGSDAADRDDALAWIDAERREAALVRADWTASIAGIDRIESALRVMALRMREHRGVRARRPRVDPVDDADAELAYREQARAAVDELTLSAGATTAADAPAAREPRPASSRR